MSQSLFIAIDLGSQSSKAAIVSLTGNILCRHTSNYTEITSAHQGIAEVDPEWFSHHIAQTCADLICTALQENINLTKISAIGITTFRNTLVLLDEDCLSVLPSILWTDQRLAKQVPILSWYWRVLFNLANVFYPLKASILTMQRQASLNLIAEISPSSVQNTKHLALMSGYLTQRLTGKLVDCTANIIGYLPFNYRSKKWYSRFAWQFQALSVKSSWLPKLVKPGHIVGTIRTAFLEQITRCNSNKLPENLKDDLANMQLVTTAADKSCEILGSGCVKSGQLHLSLGSAVTINLLSDKFIGPKPLYPAYPSFDQNLYLIEVMLEKGLVLVTEFTEHYKSQLEYHLDGLVGESLLERLEHYLVTNDISAGSLTFNLAASENAEHFRDCFELPAASVSDNRNIFNQYVAIIESIVTGIQQAIAVLTKRSGVHFSQMYVSGGGCNSAWLLHQIAQRTQLKLIKAESAEPGVLGAAIICSVGQGKYKNYTDAVEAMVKPGKIQ